MTTASPETPTASRPSSRHVVLFVVVLVAARMLASNVGRFSEGDEISIASGIMSIVRGVPGESYRYPVQFGYYQLVAALVTLLGGDAARVPIVMSWLSIAAGVAIPLAGLLSFRDVLTSRERWLVGLALAANPIIWMSSRYGNTAVVSVALTAGAVAILSNRPALKGEVIAMLLFGAAVTVRADAVLVSGVFLFLLWRNHRRVVRSLAPLVVTGAIVLGIGLLLRAVDPRMGSVATAVGTHVSAPLKTRFFDFLIWAVSPLPLFFAGAGLRELHRERRDLFFLLIAWGLPPLLFYFPSTSTPRYLLQGTLPLVVASAVGMLAFVGGRGWRRAASWGTVMALGFVHVLIGLSQFTPSSPRSYLKDATMPSDDGPVWTGALLYKSYIQRGMTPRALFRGRFRASSGGELGYASAFDSLRRGARRGQRVVIANGGGYSNTMHVLANLAGARVILLGTGTGFDRETEMELGGATIIAIGTSPLRGTTRQLPLRGGDELWVVHRDSSLALREIEGRVPATVSLEPLPAWTTAPRMLRFTVRPQPR
ncbi:MAG: hypothetical protein ABIZ91_03460 [Gemmatimonadaceae bacterium]